MLNVCFSVWIWAYDVTFVFYHLGCHAHESIWTSLLTSKCLFVQVVLSSNCSMLIGGVCACWTYCLIFYFYVDYQVHFQSSYFFCHKFSLERRLGVLYLDKNISTSICSLLAICYLQLFYEFFLMFNLGKDEPSTFPTSKTWWRWYYLLHKWYHRYSKGKSSIHLIIIRLLLHQ